MFSIRICPVAVNVSPDGSDEMCLLTPIQSHMFDTSETITLNKTGTFSLSVLQSGKKRKRSKSNIRSLVHNVYENTVSLLLS